MKRLGVLGLAGLFMTCMVHFYFAEDHCPVHCPAPGGHFGHVHDHHAGASICLCFWASLFSPEPDVYSGPLAFGNRLHLSALVSLNPNLDAGQTLKRRQ